MEVFVVASSVSPTVSSGNMCDYVRDQDMVDLVVGLMYTRITILAQFGLIECATFRLESLLAHVHSPRNHFVCQCPEYHVFRSPIRIRYLCATSLRKDCEKGYFVHVYLNICATGPGQGQGQGQGLRLRLRLPL